MIRDGGFDGAGMCVQCEPVVPSDVDIYRAAKLLVFQHGDAAPIQAAMCADEMFDVSDMDGKRVWLRIKAATEQLLSKTPQGQVH
jgi:hypothetical protein